MKLSRQEATQGKESGYRRCLVKAMDRTRQLLCGKGAVHDYGETHAVKSILYSTIEQTKMETDRMISAQKLLRELLTLVVLRADPARRKRQEALNILDELKTCHRLSG